MATILLISHNCELGSQEASYQTKFIARLHPATKQTASDHLECLQVCIEQKFITRTDAHLIATSKICIAALGFSQKSKNSL